MTKEYKPPQPLSELDLYRAKVLDIIINPGRWLTYYQKTPYLLDLPTTLTNLERLVREI